MTHGIFKRPPFATFFVLSVLAHLTAFSLLRGAGTFQFSAPVGTGRQLTVELQEKEDDSAVATKSVPERSEEGAAPCRPGGEAGAAGSREAELASKGAAGSFPRSEEPPGELADRSQEIPTPPAPVTISPVERSAPPLPPP